jgi:RsiW-degrading membrane proteinase PrsW (M82 family)
MKPELINKNYILNVIKKTEKNDIFIKNENDIIFFNFLIISIIILGILFLFYRYIEKKKKNNNS